MRSKAIFAAMFLILLLAANSAEAQPQEEHQTDYPSDCLADWDPFCPVRPPGSGHAYPVGCFDCAWIPEGPNGEPSYYVCIDEGSPGKPGACTNYSWGCEMSSQVCQLV